MPGRLGRVVDAHRQVQILEDPVEQGQRAGQRDITWMEKVAGVAERKFRAGCLGTQSSRPQMAATRAWLPKALTRRSGGSKMRLGSRPNGSEPAPRPGGRSVTVTQVKLITGRVQCSRRGTLRRVGQLFLPYRWSLVAVTAIIVASSLAAMVSPFLLRDIIDTALPTRNVRLLAWLVGGMVAVVVVISVLGVMQTWIATKVGQLLPRTVQLRTYRWRVDRQWRSLVIGADVEPGRGRVGQAPDVLAPGMVSRSASGYAFTVCVADVTGGRRAAPAGGGRAAGHRRGGHRRR